MGKAYNALALADALIAIRDSLDAITPRNIPVFKALCDKALSTPPEAKEAAK